MYSTYVMLAASLHHAGPIHCVIESLSMTALTPPITAGLLNNMRSEMNISGNQMPLKRAGKSLKEQNRWQLWLVVAANALFLFGVVRDNAIKIDGLRALFVNANNLLPAGFALVVSIVLNGLLSAENKARLVFLRWRNALPGHRAFSEYALSDPRIDVEALTKQYGPTLPADPVKQNRTWYSIYKTVEKEPAVEQVHRDFLLLRDYTGLCALFIVSCGPAVLYILPSTKIASLYFLILFLQYIIVRQAAFNYGVRFVTTVLAQKAATPEAVRKRKGVAQ
jgi:hypothetical protein